MQTIANISTISSFLQSHEIAFLVDEPLRRHCSWRVGGPADFVCYPDSPEKIVALVGFLCGNDCPYMVCGKGSNLLFADAGLRGVLIKLDRQWAGYYIEGERLSVQSGIFAGKLAHIAWSLSLTGLEHIVGIPGNLGGLVAMNGGSLRNSIGSSVEWVKVLTAAGEVLMLDNDNCGFSYRRSRFLDSGELVLGVGLKLTAGDPATIHSNMLEILRTRRDNFPRRHASCGSVFKSPQELYGKYGPAGAIIEKLGLKGFRVGDAEISVKHANFIINRGAATAADILAVIETVQQAYFNEYAETLPCEFRAIDDLGRVR